MLFIPPIIWGIFEIATAAITAYEVYELIRDIYQDVDKFQKSVDQAKERIRAQIEAIKKEVNTKIDIKSEPAHMLFLSAADAQLQSETTKKAKGRLGEGGPEIQAAIPQKIPFRTVITMVYNTADRVPTLSLRRKKGIKIQNLVGRKKEIMLELLALSIEELADIDLDEFVLVRLRQLMAAHIFEFMDELLNWQSPLKTEVCFGKSPTFADPKLSGTRLFRESNGINPFHPMPHKQKGSLAADLVVPDYRSKPLKKDNAFAIIEIKFQGDKIKNTQFKRYEKLSKACAKAKTGVVGRANTAGGKGVTCGCRVSLFRHPEDVAIAQDPPARPSPPIKQQINEMKQSAKQPRGHHR